MSVPSFTRQQTAFIQARRHFTTGLWAIFQEVRRKGFPKSTWDYNVLGPQGDPVTEQDQHEIDGQQVHVQAKFSRDDKEFRFAVWLTNSVGWDLIILVKPGHGSDQLITASIDDANLATASEEVENILWDTLAKVDPAHRSGQILMRS